MSYDALVNTKAEQLLNSTMSTAKSSLKKNSQSKDYATELRSASNEALRRQLKMWSHQYAQSGSNDTQLLHQIDITRRAIEFLYPKGDQTVFFSLLDQQYQDEYASIRKKIFSQMVEHQAAGILEYPSMKDRIMTRLRDECEGALLPISIIDSPNFIQEHYEPELENIRQAVYSIGDGIYDRLIQLESSTDLVAEKHNIRNNIRAELLQYANENMKEILENENSYQLLFEKIYQKMMAPPKLENSSPAATSQKIPTETNTLSPRQETVVRHLEQSAADMRSNPSGFSAILKSLSDFIKNFTGIDLPSVSFKSKLQKTVGRAPEQGQTPPSNAPSGADANANAENDNIPPTHGL